MHEHLKISASLVLSCFLFSHTSAFYPSYFFSANTKLGISEEDPNLKHQFRYPSPGSQPPVREPETDASFGNAADDPYDVAYYKRDTGRRYTSEPGEGQQRDLEKIRLELLPQDDPRVKEAMEEFEKGPGSSPGNKGQFALAKTNYDPTGLRASMSTSWKATQESLDSNMPDHVSFSNCLLFPFMSHPIFHFCCIVSFQHPSGWKIQMRL